MQQYIVFSDGALAIDFHYSDSVSKTRADDDEVKATVVTGDAKVPSINNDALAPLQAVYVPYTSVSADGLDSYLITLEAHHGNTVILQMKPENGNLIWESGTSLSHSYGTGGTTPLRAMLSSLHDDGIHVVADISCFVDNAITSRNQTLALTNRVNEAYSDTYGSWLDPYNGDVQDYIAELVEELCTIGFDEIMLSNYCLPVEGTMGDRQADADAQAAANRASNNTGDNDPASGDDTGDDDDTGAAEPQIDLSVYYVNSESPAPITTLLSTLAERLHEITSAEDVLLSIRCDNAVLRSNSYLGPLTGQEFSMLIERFNRIYCNTNTENLESDIDIMENLLGDELNSRFVPIMRSTPAGDADSSWAVR